jgi:hypothetical protein
MVSLALFSAMLACAPESNTDKRGNVLEMITDIPMPGLAVRFDYQSLDAKHGRLLYAYMN